MPIVVTLSTARTLGDLKARIADELARSDLSPQIALAIEDAINEAAGNRFWFNEVRGLTFNTVIGQDYYGSPDISALTEIDGLWITVSGGRRNLRVMNNGDIDSRVQGTQINSEPTGWARYGDSLRFYPTPDRIYPVTVDGVSRLLPLNYDTDSNGWTDTTKGERLVRAIAKRNLLAEVIRDPAEAQIQDGLAVRFREELQAQTYDRNATGQMRAHG